MAIFKSAPALACSNTIAFKLSPHTQATATMLVEAYYEVGLPSGCLNDAQGAAETGQALTRHPNIAMMIFTGSVPTEDRGEIIADYISRCQLGQRCQGCYDGKLHKPGTDVFKWDTSVCGGECIE